MKKNSALLIWFNHETIFFQTNSSFVRNSELNAGTKFLQSEFFANYWQKDECGLVICRSSPKQPSIATGKHSQDVEGKENNDLTFKGKVCSICRCIAG